MKTTLTLIKADVGSIAGHVRSSNKMMVSVINHMKKIKLSTILNQKK